VTAGAAAAVESDGHRKDTHSTSTNVKVDSAGSTGRMVVNLALSSLSTTRVAPCMTALPTVVLALAALLSVVMVLELRFDDDDVPIRLIVLYVLRIARRRRDLRAFFTAVGASASASG
jgi:hypothetical protein